MSFSLYSSYNWSQLRKRAAGPLTPLSCYDNFFTTPNGLICVIVIAKDRKEFLFSTPVTLTWYPSFQPADAIAFLRRGKLPLELDKAFLTNVKTNHLFVSNTDQKLMYVGKILLSFIGKNETDERIVNFQVSPKLSRDAWSLFGSYSDWHLLVNGQSLGVSTLSELKAILNENWHQSVLDIWLTRYEEDKMHLVTNGEYAFVDYVDEEKGVSLASRNPNYQGDVHETFTFAGYRGSDWDVEEQSVVSKREAFDLLTAFFRTGYPQGLVESI